MGLLDPVFNALENLLTGIDNIIEAVTNPDIDGEQASQVIAQGLEDVSPAEEVSATLVDLVEEFVIADLAEAGELTPENVERIADQTEGAAISIIASLGLFSTAIEAAGLGQLENHQEMITQILAGLQVDDVTGTELEARKAEGIMPAMQAKVDKEHRSKFVNVQDAVEYLLRNKDGDTGWLQGDNIPQEEYEKVRSNNPVNAQNALEEWGIRDDQLDIMEFVGLEAMEFEELIETPAELGLIVDDEVLDLVLDLAGYPEPLKDFLRQVPEEIPRSNRAWEERTAVESLVDELEPLAADGEISPQDARQLLPDEVDTAKDALEDRFANLQTVPAGSPTRSLIEGSFARGYTDVDTYQNRLERLEYDTEAYEGAVKASILDELDGDLQESVALGLVSENEFSNLCEFVGLDEDATQALLSGQSLSDITERRLKEQQSPAELSVEAVQGIGESRGTALRAVGIETVADLAAADVETVAETTQVSPETAEEWITIAQQATSQ